MGTEFLNKVVRVGFTVKVIVKQNLKEVKDQAMQKSGGREFQAENIQCKGPEVGACREYSRNIKQALWMAGTEGERETVIMEGLKSILKT